jgi:tetratricopeptide (TPR) repeat protein
MYKKGTLFFLIFLIFCVFRGGGGLIWALDFDSGAYGSISDIYHADDNTGLTVFPVLRVPMGGRSEGMGTAFTAVADDLTFIEWNPAGSSMLTYSELGVFHNNWIADTKVESVVFASRVDDLGFGVSGKWLYTPFSEYNMSGEQVSKGYYSEAVATLNISYNFLAGYYFSGISLGVNLKGAFRFMPDYSDADDQGSNGETILSGSEQSAAMVMADIGALTRFNALKLYDAREKNTSVAFVIRNVGPPVKNEPLSALATAALAYKPIRPLTLAFDYTFPVNMQDFSLSEKPYWAAGMNVNITDFLSMRAGVLGQNGNYRISMGSAVTMGAIELDLNYSLDLLTQFTPLNRISLGFHVNLGDQGRQSKSDKVDTLYLAGLDAYTAGNISEAKKNWEEALAINPRFDPAKEGLNLIKNSTMLDTRIEEMQSLETYR